MFQYPWPKGTVHATELPANLQVELNKAVSTTGIVDPGYVVQNTATEGPFISFAGYKVRVTIESTSPTTFIVRLA